MHSCKSAIELLQAFLEGELSPQEHSELEKHLQACPPCVQFVESYQKTSKLCRNALETKMPSQLAASLCDFLKKPCR
jgi:anti-sigma factor (TIGR02949 family)